MPLTNVAAHMIVGWVAALVIVNASAVPLRDGTLVQVKLSEFISSETSAAGDGVRFNVADDLIVDGVVVITRGTLATGRIVDAAPTKFTRGGWLRRSRLRAGRLVFAVSETTSVDGQAIRLRAPDGLRERGLITGGRPPLLKWAHEGARFDVRVDGDYVVNTQP